MSPDRITRPLLPDVLVGRFCIIADKFFITAFLTDLSFMFSAEDISCCIFFLTSHKLVLGVTRYVIKDVPLITGFASDKSLRFS